MGGWGHGRQGPTITSSRLYTRYGGGAEGLQLRNSRRCCGSSICQPSCAPAGGQRDQPSVGAWLGAAIQARQAGKRNFHQQQPRGPADTTSLRLWQEVDEPGRCLHHWPLPMLVSTSFERRFGQ